MSKKQKNLRIKQNKTKQLLDKLIMYFYKAQITLKKSVLQ